MLESSTSYELDEIDLALLQVLQGNGRITNQALAQQINLSPPATHARTKRLEELGYIQQYLTQLNREQMGFDMICFIHISLQMHQSDEVERFRAVIRAIPEVLECHHITGEFDYLLKVVIKNRKDLERFVVHQLTPIQGVARIYTSIVLTEVKASTALPITHPPAR